MDTIELTHFSVACIIGILPRERVTPQTMEIEVDLHLDLDGAAFGDLTKSVNYAAVLDQVTFLAEAGQWWLLESMGSAVCAQLLAPPAPGEGRALIDRVDLLLKKPEVLGGKAVPAIRMSRAQGWRALAAITLAEGVVAEVLQVADGVGAYRVRFEPGAEWELPAGAQGIEFASADDGGRSVLLVARPPLDNS